MMDDEPDRWSEYLTQEELSAIKKETDDLIKGWIANLSPAGTPMGHPVQRHTGDLVSNTHLDAAALRNWYQACLHRLRVLERYPSPDWSIVDKWIARELLQTGTPPGTIAAVLQHGSPGFPRRHGDPEDYLHRTIHCAAQQIHSSVFPARMSAQPPHHLLD